MRMPMFFKDGEGGGGGGGTGGGAGAPQAIVLTPDSLIQVPGSDKPVKFSDYAGGYIPKADHDKLSGEYSTYKTGVANALREYLQSLQQGGGGRGPAGGGGGGMPTTDEFGEMLDSLKEAQWIDGPTFNKIISKMNTANTQTIEKLTRMISFMYQQMMGMGKELTGMKSGSAESTLKAKIGDWLKEKKFPAKYQEFVEDLFAAYEGTDDEIFDLAAKKIQAYREADKAQTQDDARQRAAAPKLPGRGGDVKVKTQTKDDARVANPREAVDALAGLFQSDDVGE